MRRPSSGPDRSLALAAAAAVDTAGVRRPGGRRQRRRRRLSRSTSSQSPWTVALSSRDRFGGTRAGQFCGGVVVGPTTVLTAAHCLGAEVLGGTAGPGARPEGHRRAAPTCSRPRARRSRCATPGSTRTTTPTPTPGTSRCSPWPQPLPESSRHPHGRRRATRRTRPGTAAAVYGWGDTTGRGDYAHSLRAARGARCCRTRLRAGLPGQRGRHVPAPVHAVRRGAGRRPGRLPGGQRRAAGRPGAAGRAGVLGERLWAAGQPGRLHAGLGGCVAGWLAREPHAEARRAAARSTCTCGRTTSGRPPPGTGVAARRPVLSRSWLVVDARCQRSSSSAQSPERR